MKIPDGTKSILCVCTGGKDRSPIMAEYFRSLGYEARAVGISEYHTTQNGTDWCSLNDLFWADTVFVVSTVHEAFVRGVLRGAEVRQKPEIRILEKLGPFRCEGEFWREGVLSLLREAFPVSGGR